MIKNCTGIFFGTLKKKSFWGTGGGCLNFQIPLHFVVLFGADADMPHTLMVFLVPPKYRNSHREKPVFARGPKGTRLISFQTCGSAGIMAPGPLPHFEIRRTKNKSIEFSFILILTYLLFTAFVSRAG